MMLMAHEKAKLSLFIYSSVKKNNFTLCLSIQPSTRGKQKKAIIAVDQTHTVSQYDEKKNCLYSVKRHLMNNEVYFNLVHVSVC